jgi:hypothetical protein
MKLGNASLLSAVAMCFVDPAFGTDATFCPAGTALTTVGFSKFASGAYVSSIGFGISVSVQPGLGGKAVTKPRIYNSNGVGGADPDLEVGLGNLLIIQEENGANNAPDDNEKGGKFLFKFAPPTKIKSIGLVDVEEKVIMTFVHSSGPNTSLVPMTTVNGGTETVPLSENAVVSLKVAMKGSGGISFIEMCVPYCVLGIPHLPDTCIEVATLTPHSSPSSSPSRAPSSKPSGAPSGAPSGVPSGFPSRAPSGSPIRSPSGSPSRSPSGSPIRSPSGSPSRSPSSLPSGTPSTSPSRAPSSVPTFPSFCPVGSVLTTVGFNQYKSGAPIASGDYVSNPGYGFTVSVQPGLGGKSVTKPRIYNSNNVGGADPDLEVGLGNLLIIQEENGANNAPDDNELGGKFIFKFAAPTQIKSIGLVDVEDTSLVPMPTVNGGTETVPLSENAVVSLKVAMKGSGGISFIEMCVPTM